MTLTSIFVSSCSSNILLTGATCADMHMLKGLFVRLGAINKLTHVHLQPYRDRLMRTPWQQIKTATETAMFAQRWNSGGQWKPTSTVSEDRTVHGNKSCSVTGAWHWPYGPCAELQLGSDSNLCVEGFWEEKLKWINGSGNEFYHIVFIKVSEVTPLEKVLSHFPLPLKLISEH